MKARYIFAALILLCILIMRWEYLECRRVGHGKLYCTIHALQK